MIIPERINLLIAAIQKTGAVCMSNWQTVGSNFARTLDQLHPCGNRACIAGHLALMPEFKAIGGRYNLTSGAPIIEVDDQFASMEGALIYWLTEEIDQFTTEEDKITFLVAGRVDDYRAYRWDDWTHLEAIAALEILRDQPELNFSQFADATYEMAETYDNSRKN